MRRAVLFLVLIGAVPATLPAQVPAGPEFRISAAVGPYSWPDMAANQDGSFVVTWTDRQGPGSDVVMARRYDAAGAPLDPGFVVGGPFSYAVTPRVASDRQGNFTVTWADADGLGCGISARRFAAGAALGPAFRINTTLAGRDWAPDVASDAARNLFVVWASQNIDGSAYGIAGQRYDSAGNTVGGEILVNTSTMDMQLDPAIASDPNGRFVVVWSSYQGGSAATVYGQRYDLAGRMGGEFRVTTQTLFDQFEAAVAMDASGNFVVVWVDGREGPDFGIFAQRFAASGARLGGEFHVNSYTTGDQFYPAVACNPNGSFSVAWSSVGQDGSAYGVFAQRYDASGARIGGEFLVNTGTAADENLPTVASGDAGGFVVAWQKRAAGAAEVFGQRFGPVPPPPPPAPDPGGNGVFEPGESVDLVTSWRNLSGAPQTATGAASQFTGPGAPNNPTYTIADATASYGTVPDGGTGNCAATGNCFVLSIGPVTIVPNARPALHWDATFREDILPGPFGPPRTHVLHIGDSFFDVPRSSGFYRFVETILHHNLTGGCGGGNFCPLQSTPREQMAVFVLVAKEGSGYQPPACVPGLEMFADVPASSSFCRWIEELAHRNIAGGCGGGNFCPLASVSREQMAVFALATKEPAGYSPVACVAGAERFTDVPATSPFCKWIEELARRNIAGGCGGGNFCPIAAVSREQNAVFVSGTFALSLY